MQLHRLIFLGAFLFGVLVEPCLSFAKSDYTKQELSLSKPPPGRLRDRRLKRVYKSLAKTYKHIYGYAAQDGYLVPKELQELGFHRRLIRRIIDIDENNTRIQKELKLLKKKQWRLRRRGGLKETDKKRQTELTIEQERVEKMIRRFACRHDAGYKKRNPQHCPKIKI
ncbi:MAG: hypothetical protein H6728_17580 [Myxococcales bacterium]|nr:hypothetical protein [Myxococcales bacterium]MCB9644886.1 hypothetical protein [Myxococcales bacterium]